MPKGSYKSTLFQGSAFQTILERLPRTGWIIKVKLFLHEYMQCWNNASFLLFIVFIVYYKLKSLKILFGSLFSQYEKKDQFNIMSDIGIIYSDSDCSFLLQIILGLSIKSEQWIIGKENSPNPVVERLSYLHILVNHWIKWRVNIICFRKKYKVLKICSQFITLKILSWKTKRITKKEDHTQQMGKAKGLGCVKERVC